MPLTAPGRTLPPSPPRGSLGAASAAERRRSQRPDGCVRTGGVAVAKPGRRRGARTALRGPAGRSEEPRAAGSSIPRRLPRARSTVGSRSPRGNHHRHLCHRYHRHGQVQRLPELGRGAGGGVFGTRRRLRITGSCRGPTRHRGGPSAPAARMFAQAEECLPRCLEDRRVPESCLRPGQERGAEEPPTPDSAAVGGAGGGEGGTGSPRPRWLRAPSLRRCRAPPAARGRAPRCAAAIGPEAASAARDSAAARRCAAGGRGTAGALVPGGRPDLGIAGPSSRVIFFLFVLQTAPDGRSSAFHLEINEGREKRDLVFLR